MYTIDNLINVKNVFVSLETTSGRKAKEEILAENKNNLLFKEILNFVYNPYILTGISTKKISKNLKPLDKPMDNILEVMDYIKVNNTGRDHDIRVVKTYIESVAPSLEPFLIKVFTKNLKVGITLKTINKIFDNFIPEYSVMLAEKFEDNEKRVKGNKFILTTKLDGRRVTTIKDGGMIQTKTRQGLTVEGLVEIEEDYKNLPDGVYDGELCAIGEFEDSKAMFKETSKKAGVKGEKRGLKMVCFDYIQNPQDFYNGKCDTPCEKRKLDLAGIITQAKSENKVQYIESLEILYYGDDLDVIPEIMEKATENGEEGLMCNIADAPYECKRSKNILKLKKFQSADLRVIDMEEGRNKNIGRLGAIIVDYKGYPVGVGYGFSDIQRQEFWDNKNDMIGTIIEVEYFEETTNEQGGLSLRFAGFKGIRDDKTEPSYF